MNREILFAQTLEQVKKTAKEQGNCISKEQVQEAFEPLFLGDEQFQMVYDYLQKNKIGIDEKVNLDDYLNDQEADYLEEYLQQLKGFPERSEGEKEAVTLSAMAGDPDAQKCLIEIFLPQVAQIAKLYAGQGVFLEDLIGEGNVALTMAVTMLGALEHASEAQGMIGKMIMDAMEELIMQDADEAKKDQKFVDRVNRVAGRAKELSEELRRKVTVEELADETGMSRKSILDAVRISGGGIDTIQM